jgi:hypothetical protein
MHYFIVIIIIVVIVILQFSSFLSNNKKLSLFENIFPMNSNNFHLLQENTDLEITTQHKNDILDTILSSLNNYLRNNKGAVSDYHLMKDIVDRNCDAQEEEIHSQIPVPLYLGLAGTMLGILIGIGFLVFSGGLNDLLNSSNGQGSKGIETLLGSVALAMISSITGISLTTIGSHKTQNVKSEVEKDKNNFLSWIQAELLPKISSDISSALVRMTKNLSIFNNTFAQNTQEFRGVLTQVNDSYQKQTVLVQAINRLKISDIATANIEVYDKLKNSTDEIGVFAQYLQNTNQYLTTIQALNQKLDNYEGRTQVIESAGRFFSKNEKWLAENFDIANLEVKTALERFKESTGGTLSKLEESLNSQILNFDTVMRSQQESLKETLQITTEILAESFTKTQQTFEKTILSQQQEWHNKLQETSKIVDELKNLTHIKEGIKDFKEATYRQNGKIEELTKEIRALATAKIEGGAIKHEINLPKYIKILTIAGSILFTATCILYILPRIMYWITILKTWLF